MICRTKKVLSLMLTLVLVCSLAAPALASGVTYMPDVTPEMSDPAYWAALCDDAQEVILTLAKGTMVMDLRTAKETFDGFARNQAIQSSSTADAKYYFGWTYGGDGKKADWSYYQRMINNCVDPRATENMPVRYGIAVNRTLLQVFPSANPIWDDPKDPDFNYQALSSIRVNEPMLIYTTSRRSGFPHGISPRRSSSLSTAARNTPLTPISLPKPPAACSLRVQRWSLSPISSRISSLSTAPRTITTLSIFRCAAATALTKSRWL